MAVAAGDLPQTLPLGELGKEFANFLKQKSPPRAFFGDLEQILFGFQFQRKPGGHLESERNFFVTAGGNPGLAENQSVADLEAFDQMIFLFGILREEVFHQIFGDGFLIFPFIQDFDDAKQSAAFTQNIGPAIGIFLQLFYDLSRATDFYDSSFSRQNYTYLEIFVHASRDHHSVTLLENVQRERHAREQHHFKREQRNASGSHDVELTALRAQRNAESAACISSLACMSPAF